MSILDKPKCLGLQDLKRVLRRCRFPWGWQDSSQLFASPWQWGRNWNPWESIVAPALSRWLRWCCPLYNVLWLPHIVGSSHLNGVRQMLSSRGLMQASESSCSGLCSVLPISTAPSSYVFMWLVPEFIKVVSLRTCPSRPVWQVLALPVKDRHGGLGVPAASPALPTLVEPDFLFHRVPEAPGWNHRHRSSLWNSFFPD